MKLNKGKLNRALSIPQSLIIGPTCLYKLLLGGIVQTINLWLSIVPQAVQSFFDAISRSAVLFHHCTIEKHVAVTLNLTGTILKALIGQELINVLTVKFVHKLLIRKKVDRSSDVGDFSPIVPQQGPDTAAASLALTFILLGCFELEEMIFHRIGPQGDSVQKSPCPCVDMLLVCPLCWRPEPRELVTSGQRAHC